MAEKPPGRIKSVLLQWLGVTIDPGDRALIERLFGGTWAGRPLKAQDALQLSTVWACVRLISESIATLPLAFYRRKGDGSRKLASDHPLYSVLHSQPNANMAAITFWEAVVASMLLWGNAYIEIKRNGGGVIVALDFLMPNRMEVKLGENGLLTYRYTDSAHKTRNILAANLMHIPAFTVDGLRGLSPVAYGAQVLSTASVTDEASAKVFRYGMRASGFLKSKDILKPGQREQLRESMERFRGSELGGTMVLEADMDYKPLSMNPVDAELLASRAWNVEELCRWFRVPPFMVGHSEKSTSWGTGIEQQMIGFVTFVLRPWCVRIEQAINRSLLAPGEKGRYFAEFALEGLLRGDSAARAAFYGVMIDKGILTRDEVRALENWPAMNGNAGVLTVQSATVPLDGITNAPAAPAVPPAKNRDALDAWLLEK